MKKLIKSTIVTVAFILTAYSHLNAEDKAPVKLSVENAWNTAHRYYYPKLVITSLSDSVTIKNLTVNRGGCSITKKDFIMKNGRLQYASLFPNKLSFGRSTDVRVDKNCTLLEVSIETSLGDWTYSFQ